MTGIAARRPPVHVLAVSRAGLGTMFVAMLLVLVSIGGTLNATPSQRHVMIPLYALINIAFISIAILYVRDGVLPGFDIGLIYIAATFFYSAIPLMNYVAAGFRWQPDSDFRLYWYQLTPEQVGAFSWRHVLYLFSFAATYVIVRGRSVGPIVPRPRIDTASAWIIAIFAGLTLLYTLGIELYVGSDALAYGGAGVASAGVPFFVVQITHIVASMALTLKQCLAMLLVMRWRSWKWRLVLFAWLGFEVLGAIRALASRAPTVILLLTVGMLYHRLVRPFTLKRALLVGGAFVVAFLVFGVARDRAQGNALAFTPAHNNEFQVLWGNAYDLHIKKERDQVDAPWQVYAAEWTLIIPSQILPFTKMDPSTWYGEKWGLSGAAASAFMFGAIAQCVIGFDWIEIAIRAALLGLIFAMLHRHYVRRANSFWWTAFYVFMCAWSYYTFRSTTFWILYFVIYQFLTVYVLVRVLRLVIERGRRLRHAVVTA